MNKGRLEAFSDGVFAIIITIMVLELRIPSGNTFLDLLPVIPTFLSYLLSFLYLAIYWNNHHHLLQITKGVTGKILWANINLLFWLTLIPFVTAWVGNNYSSNAPAVAYGMVLFLSAISYFLLVKAIIAHDGKGSPVDKAVGKDKKGKISLFLYGIAILSGFFIPYFSILIYGLVALLWIIPDPRIEKQMK